MLILLDEYNTMQEHVYNMHKKAFNKVLMQIKLDKKVPIANNAGYKDSSANIELTKETIVPTFNKINKIKRALSKYIDDTRVPLNKLYDDKLIKLNELKKVNSEFNKLLDTLYMHFFNKKVIKESILENTNTKNNIMKYTKITDNKRACIENIEEYVDDICTNIHAKIKNNMLNEANIELLNIKKHVSKYINDMCDHNAKSTNKKINNNNANKKNKNR